jgi:hypothetical protein
MSITFVCSCGKRLRARDEMASRRSMCPRCGAPVGIPSLQPTHPGGQAGPLSPQEIARRRARIDPEGARDAIRELGPASVRVRRRRGNLNNSDGPDWRPLDAPLVCPAQEAGKPAAVTPRRKRHHWRLETRWYECLLYPCRAWTLVVGLSLAQTALTAAAATLLPDFFEARATPGGWVPVLIFVLPLLLLGYTAGFLDGVLTSAIAGRFSEVRWPGFDIRPAAFGALRWLVCFLAGPVLPAVVAGWFWLSCGDPRFLDRLILAELGLLAVGSWLLALAASGETSRLRDANPECVGALVLRLGACTAVPLLVAPVVFFACARLAVAALERLHRDTLEGWLMLLGAWLAGMFLAAFLFRLLGWWCYSTRHLRGVAE